MLSGRQIQYGEWLRASLINKTPKKTSVNLSESSKLLERRARMSETEGSTQEGRSFRELRVGDQGIQRADREMTDKGQQGKCPREGIAELESHPQHQEASQVGRKLLDEGHILRVPRQEETILAQSMQIQEQQISVSERIKFQHEKPFTGIQQTLVNIPIQEVGISEVLTELDNQNRSALPKCIFGQGGKRWKRSTGKKNFLPGNVRMEEEGPIASNKRSWQLIDVSEGESVGDLGTYTKKQKMEVMRFDEQVEETNLKWPQLYK